MTLAAHAHLMASGDSAFGAGFIAFIVVLVLCVASYFLFRSMNRHLRKVPTSFDATASEQEETK